MKQALFLAALEIVAIFGIAVAGPITAVGVYYLFAVLRPQYIWQWALPVEVSWSQYPAIAAILATLVGLIGVKTPSLHGQPATGLSRTHWLMTAFGAWVWLTYFTAFSQDAAWPWLQEYLKIFTMFLVAAYVVRTLNDVWMLYLAVTLPLLYIAYDVNSKYFFDGRLDIYHVGYGGLDNNGAGLMLAMAVPLAIGAFEAMSGKVRWLFVAAIPLVMHSVLVTYSRGAMLSLIVVTPILIWRSKRRWQMILVVLALASTVPFLAGREIRQRFFTVSQYEADDSANSRFESWNAAFQIANDHPFFGVGIRNANLFSYQYGADQEGRTIHSQFLQILADEGYPGLLLYVGTFLSLFAGTRQVRRLLRDRDDASATRTTALANGIESSLIVFCVGAVFLSLEVFELPYLLILLGTQLTLVAAAEARQAEPPAQPATAARPADNAVRGLAWR